MSSRKAFTLVELLAVSKRKAGGFTLVELLVVVAILSLLVSILMPSLQQVTELGRRAVCLSNEHQIGLAAFAYTTEYKGQMPCGYRSSPYATWDTLLLPYGATLDLIICPSQKFGTRHYWANANFANQYVGDTTGKQTGVLGWSGYSARLSDLSQADSTIALTEERDQFASYAYGGVSVPGGGWGSCLLVFEDLFILQYVHLDRENVVFCDGHVSNYTFDELLAPANANGDYVVDTSFFLFRRVKK